ncbi:LysR family transcriptional regulator [Belnapia sp. T6]|uniref:LysR family transcriptional regulator n=1 Tax=Belnapia mucosa TaxID=2804532 RepID=A0ABS1V999_9PROT|nr:LysR family transcriptional regulator [Belnapia mucosa]MBL6458245.1 LysR family transcriptional regulator [Belnapia mucosa]
MLNPRSLEALRAFVEGGSVSEAAARLGRTQPQVGRLLAALEAELGFPLFDRRNRRLALTAEGARFYAQVERILAGHAGLERLAGDIRAGRQDSHLRVLVAPQSIGALLGDPLARMVAEMPGFTATIETRVRLDIESWLGQEAFDLGLTVLPLAHPAVEVEEFCRAEAVVVMRQGHPLSRRASLSLADLAGQDLVMTHPRSLIRQQVDQLFRDAGMTPRVRLETGSGAVACQLAAMGLGLAVADPFVALSSGAAGLAMRRFRPSIALPYGLLFPVWQPRSRTVAAFAALVASSGRRQVAALSRRLGRVRSG